MKTRYPCEASLKRIAEWPSENGWHALLAFVKEEWEYENYFRRDGDKIYRLSTGGWSGNEDLICALQENVIFWSMCWQMSKRGGHYEFEVNGVN